MRIKKVYTKETLERGRIEKYRQRMMGKEDREMKF